MLVVVRDFNGGGKAGKSNTVPRNSTSASNRRPSGGGGGGGGGEWDENEGDAGSDAGSGAAAAAAAEGDNNGGGGRARASNRGGATLGSVRIDLSEFREWLGQVVRVALEVDVYNIPIQP